MIDGNEIHTHLLEGTVPEKSHLFRGVSREELLKQALLQMRN